MNSVSEAQKKLLPEMIELLKKRYSILKAIQLEGPIGRRALSEFVRLSEREVRKETDVLRDQRLVITKSGGMIVSSDGEEVLDQLKETVHEWSGLPELEAILEKALAISKVVIIPQNSEDKPAVKVQMGKEAARFLEKQFSHYKRIAVTGGSTMAAVADELRLERPNRALQFIAARGGLGEDVLLQANTIASKFADKTGGTCKTFYLPDHLSAEAYATMMKEPFIKEMTELYDTAEVVIHGIGDAEEMARRRMSSQEEMAMIQHSGAAGEAFGYYFDETGKAVYHIRSVGIQLEQLKKVPVILAVAGGKSKAKAILSYLKHAPERTVLITDEGAAATMVEYIQNTGGIRNDIEISN